MVVSDSLAAVRCLLRLSFLFAVRLGDQERLDPKVLCGGGVEVMERRIMRGEGERKIRNYPEGKAAFQVQQKHR